MRRCNCESNNVFAFQRCRHGMQITAMIQSLQQLVFFFAMRRSGDEREKIRKEHTKARKGRSQKIYNLLARRSGAQRKEISILKSYLFRQLVVASQTKHHHA